MSLMGRVRVASSGWSGAPGLNTIYFQNDADPSTFTSGDAQVCVDRVRGAFNSNNALFPNAWTAVVSPDVDVITAATGVLATTFSVTPPSGIVGTGGTQYGPLAADICVRLHTADIRDGHRIGGRWYLGPLTATSDSDGSPTAAKIALALSVGVMCNVVSAGAPRLVVWSRPKNGAGGVAALVTSVTIKDTFAVLRSRRA